jgi:hypothetical protein
LKGHSNKYRKSNPKGGLRLKITDLGIGYDMTRHELEKRPAFKYGGYDVRQRLKRWSAEIYVAEENLYRVTLTAPLINQSALVAFLVAGATKARVLKEVLEGPWDPNRLPAQLIRPQNSNLYWLVDKKASSLVNHKV